MQVQALLLNKVTDKAYLSLAALHWKISLW